MTVREFCRVSFLAVALGLSVTVADAHHTYVKDFDNKKLITLAGTVGSVRYANPHISFELIVSGTTWMIHTESIPVAMKSGLTKEKLVEGAKATVTGWTARDGSAGLGLSTISIGGGPTVTVKGSAR